jgi:hypothetical protein
VNADLTLFDGDRCPACGGPIERAETGRPAIYCSHACRQKAFRDVTKLDLAPTSTPTVSPAAPIAPAAVPAALAAIAGSIETPFEGGFGCRAYCEVRAGGFGVAFGRDGGRANEAVGPVFPRPRQAVELSELLNTRLIAA